MMPSNEPFAPKSILFLLSYSNKLVYLALCPDTYLLYLSDELYDFDLWAITDFYLSLVNPSVWNLIF